MSNEQKNLDSMFNQLNTEDIQKPKKRKIFIIIPIVVFVILLVSGIGYIVYRRLPKEQKIQQDIKISEETHNDIQEGTQAGWLRTSPLELPDWARKKYDGLTEEDIQAMMTDMENTFIGWSSLGYPSEEDGFTMNKEQEYDEDGLPNDFYVTMTKEQFVKAVSYVVNRVVNPMFGGWVSYQSPGKSSTSTFAADVYKYLATADFTQNLIEEKIDNPILIDKKQNFYDGKIQLTDENNGKAKFVGIVRTGNISFDDNENTTVDLVVDYYINKETIFTSKQIQLSLKEDGGGLFLIDKATVSEVKED